MIQSHDSLIVQTLSRLLIPVIQLYSVYILFHAQYSPGGGFVGGVLFGTSMVLTILVFGTGHAKGFIEKMAFRADGLGLLLFLSIGTLCILFGELFFNYAALQFPGLDPASRRSLGIVGTQIGVALDVSVVAISIFFSLSLQEEDHEMDG
ncbi:MAG: MnhB domain-containing protein [Nitrospiria bacterium]